MNYLKEEFKSLEKQRQEKEKGVRGNIPFPGWDALSDETREMGPYVYLEIKDSEGSVVNRVKADNKKGLIEWRGI